MADALPGGAQNVSQDSGPARARSVQGTTILSQWAQWWVVLTGMRADNMRAATAKVPLRSAEVARIAQARNTHWTSIPSEGRQRYVGFNPDRWRKMLEQARRPTHMALPAMRAQAASLPDGVARRGRRSRRVLQGLGTGLRGSRIGSSQRHH